MRNNHFLRKSLLLLLSFVLVASWVSGVNPSKASAASDPLTAPTIVSPKDGSYVTSTTTFQWTASSGAAFYRLQIATNAALTGAVTYDDIQQNSLDIKGLIEGQEYYWQITALTNDDGVAQSDVSHFTVLVDNDPRPMNQPVETLYSGTEVIFRDDNGDKREYADDESSDVIALPFPFTLYGETYEEIYASTNGNLWFDSEIENEIAPFNDDLYVTTKSKVVYSTIGVAPNRKFVIQYTNMMTYGERKSSTPLGTFQVVLYESTNIIQFQYPNLIGLTHGNEAFGSDAWIGIYSDPDEMEYSNERKSLSEKQAIRFTPPTDQGSYMMSSDADYEPILLIPDSFPGSSLLVSPADGSYESTALTFNWVNARDDANHYRLLVATDAEFMNVVEDQDKITSTSVDVSGLEEGTKYYWKVVSFNAADNYTFSNTYKFTTKVSTETVVTNNASSITSMTATIGGDVSASDTVAQRGIVYSLNANPTYNDNKVAAAEVGTGAFTVDLAGLQSNSTYHARAYMIVGARIVYGQDVTFTTLGSQASLSAITLSGIRLDQTVSGSVYSYTASVPYTVSSTAVTATVNEVDYSGMTANVFNSANTLLYGPINLVSGETSGAIPLSVGANRIELIVLAQDGSGTTYNVTVTRAPTPPSGGGGGGISPVSSKNGKITVPVGRAGEVSLDGDIEVAIPANASTKQLELIIEKLLSTQGLTVNKEILASAVFEVLKNFPENFGKPVLLTLKFDASKVKSGQTVAIFYFDEVKKTWVKVEGGKIKGDRISADVDHFTKFAALVIDEKTGLPVTEQSTTVETPETDTEVKLSDIAGHWAAAKIQEAVKQGIVKGYTDGTFKPNATVTRAEFAVMLNNALKPSGKAAELSFSDKAKIGAWAREAIAQAVQANTIKGFSDGTFRPSAELSRAEMASIVGNALKLFAEKDMATGFADDKLIPAWAKGQIGALSKLGVMQGKTGNKFDPNATTTRAEAVTVLLKMLAQVGK